MPQLADRSHIAPVENQVVFAQCLFYNLLMAPTIILLIFLILLFCHPETRGQDSPTTLSPEKLQQELQQLLNSGNSVKVYHPTPTPTLSPIPTATAMWTPTPPLPILTPVETPTPIPQASAFPEKVVEGTWVEGDLMDNENVAAPASY